MELEPPFTGKGPSEIMIDGVVYYTGVSNSDDPYRKIRWSSCNGAYRWYCTICKKPYPMPRGSMQKNTMCHCPTDSCALIYELISDWGFQNSE